MNTTVDGKPTLLFKGIEDRLNALGVAVFTYDKRGVIPLDATFLNNQITPDYKSGTAENRAADALSAFDFVKTFPEIDPTRIVVLGHSEGTLLTIQIAEKRPEVHSLFMMGLLGRSMKDGAYYQGVTNMMRIFYLMDSNHDGKLDRNEYETFVRVDNQRFRGRFAKEHISWENMIKIDQDGDGMISDHEARFYYENLFQQMVNLVMDDSLEMIGHTPRLWFRQYYDHGPWLPDHLRFCNKIHLFEGTADIQTPYEDSLTLQYECQAKKTPLATVHFYPGLGHAMSPRIGYLNWKDTEGPMDLGVLSELTSEIQAAVNH